MTFIHTDRKHPRDITYCNDRLCLRTVCDRHMYNLNGLDIRGTALATFKDCKDRIRMEGML